MRIALLLFWCFLAASAQQQPTYGLVGATASSLVAPPRTVQGIVISRTGQPVKGALVRLHNMRTGKMRYFTTKADGAYVFTDLLGNIDYHIHASHGGLRSRSQTLSALDDSPRIILNLRLSEAKDANDKDRPAK